ncbi:hypothetical protein Sjap_025828 [Stephania japonica]|uniref:Uncharacterized protein n=1 Tax=Stephania japonica TaxID=461633 RepID=A0AAP0E5W4_9MAGN
MVAEVPISKICVTKVVAKSLLPCDSQEETASTTTQITDPKLAFSNETINESSCEAKVGEELSFYKNFIGSSTSSLQPLRHLRLGFTHSAEGSKSSSSSSSASFSVDKAVELRNELASRNPENGALASWSGDPCLPLQWEGLQCEPISDKSFIIVSIDVSSKGLNRSIPTVVAELTHRSISKALRFLYRLDLWCQKASPICKEISEERV